MAEPAKAEPQDQDAVPSEIKSSKGAENWKRLRQERDSYLKELTELRGKAEELKKAPKPTTEPSPELEALRKERDQYSEQLRVLGIERHPKFEAHFNNRTAAVIESVKQAIGGEQGDAIAKILAQPDSPNRKAQLSEAMAQMDQFDAAQVGAAALELRKINGERNAEIERAKNDYSKIQEAEKLKVQQRTEQLNKAFDSELEKAKAIEFLQPREGDEQWNAGVKQLTDHARNIFSGTLSESEAARASLWAAVGPMFQKAALASSAEIQKLQAEIKALKVATPAPGGGADPVQVQQPKYKNSIDAVLAQAENNGFVKKTA